MVLSEKLVALRKEHGYSQLYVAERLNVSRQAISRWEVGSSVPSTENLMELSRLYGVSLDELVGHDIEEKTSSSLESQAEPPKAVPRHQKIGITVLFRKRIFIVAAIVFLVFVFLLSTCLWRMNRSQRENIVDIDHLQQESTVAPDGNFGFD